MPAPQDLGLDAPGLLDAHRALEGQAVGRGLRLARALPGRLAGAVQLAEAGEVLPVLPVAGVERLVEHPELVDVDHVQVVVAHHRTSGLLGTCFEIVVVVEHDGGRPVGLEAVLVFSSAGIMNKRHHTHGCTLIITCHFHSVFLKLFHFSFLEPVDVPVLLPAVVPVVRDVPQPDQVLLVEHDRALVVPARARVS